MSHKQSILNLLQDGQKHNFRELNNICFRYGGRIFDLRKEGYLIGEERVEGVWWYWLEREPVKWTPKESNVNKPMIATPMF